MKKEKQHLNLWDLKPKRSAEWETTEEGIVVVLVPKFSNPYIVKWVLPFLSKPYFRIKLDEVGSTIWLQLDGETPISSIADKLKEKFGASVEPIELRINHFLNQLERGNLVTIEHPVQQR